MMLKSVVLLLFYVLFLLDITDCKYIPNNDQRRYYLSIEEIEWDYIGGNEIYFEYHNNNNNIHSDIFLQRTNITIGSVYRKAKYFAYESDNYLHKIPTKNETLHLGILGPIIYGSVGDTIYIELFNQASFSFNLQSHGVLELQNEEENVVNPGERKIYTWYVPPRAGPAANDEKTSIMWPYYSNVHGVKDIYSGLIGGIVITDTESSTKKGPPSNIEREFMTYFNIFDENRSLYIDYNINNYITTNQEIKDSLIKDLNFLQSNLMHSINGFMYYNLPGLSFERGEHVRWYVFTLGDETNLHSPFWHGNTLIDNNINRVDTVTITPTITTTLDMISDNQGIWLLECSVGDHALYGMTAFYTVLPETVPSVSTVPSSELSPIPSSYVIENSTINFATLDDPFNFYRSTIVVPEISFYEGCCDTCFDKDCFTVCCGVSSRAGSSTLSIKYLFIFFLLLLVCYF